jgi:hypothetical protein
VQSGRRRRRAEEAERHSFVFGTRGDTGRPIAEQFVLFRLYPRQAQHDREQEERGARRPHRHRQHVRVADALAPGHK